MKRRGFLASLLAGIGAAGTAKAAGPAAPEPAPTPTPPPAPNPRAALFPPTGDGLLWLEPVATPRDLPMLAEEGNACFVLSEDRAYVATMDEPGPKLVDTSREDLRAGFEELKAGAEGRDAAAKAYVDGVAVGQHMGVLVGASPFMRADHVYPGPERRRPGHWVPVGAVS